MLSTLPSADARRLREFLAESNYGQEGLQQIIGANPSDLLRSIPRLRERTREISRLHTLARWFVAGLEVQAQTARQWVPDWVVELCVTSGLLVLEGELLRPAVMVAPFEGLLLVTDPLQKVMHSPPPDVVLGINRTTRLLQWFTVRRPSRATLDLGAGCGVQGLLAAFHSQSVVATDLNPRASAFAAFNARFNGLERVECLTGDTFAPIGNRRFDLIVTNPPFFVSPRRRHFFCDNEMELDTFCRRLVREAPGHLNEGGYLQMLCEWAEVRQQRWPERLAEWFENTGCDAWVLKLATFEPTQYAQDCIGQTSGGDLDSDTDLFAEWMSYYDKHGVEAIHAGFVTMRRRSGCNWLYVEDIPGPIREPVGAAILRGFEARDLLAAYSNEQLLAIRPRISPEVQLEQQMRRGESGWRVESERLCHLSGLRYSLRLEPLVAEFLGNFDGRRTLGELIESLTGEVSASAEQVQSECLRVIRRLIQHGFILW